MGVNPPTGLRPLSDGSTLSMGSAKEGGRPVSPPAPDAGTPNPTPVAPPTPAPQCAAIPQSAAEFRAYSLQRIARAEAEINLLNNAIAEQERTLRRTSPTPPGYIIRTALDLIQQYNSEIAEQRLIIWLANRDLGRPQSLENLINNLQRIPTGNHAYWYAQIAMILASELDDTTVRTQLRRILGNETGWADATDPIVREQLALIQIYNQLLTQQTGAHRGEPVNELSLLIGENFFRRAMIRKNQASGPAGEEFANLLQQARTFVSRLATTTIDVGQRTPTDAQEMALRQSLLDGRAAYLRRSIQGLRETLPGDTNGGTYLLLRQEIAWANLLMANILAQETETASSQTDALNIFEDQVLPYLHNTGALRGMPLLEARRVESDVMAQIGYLRHDLGRDSSNAAFGTVLCLMDEIRNWANSYRTSLGSTPPQRWLQKIEASITVARAKLIMVLSGNIRERTAPATLALLADDLTQAERQELAQPVTRARANQIQRRLLEVQSRIISEERNRTYIGTTTPLFSAMEQTDLDLALAESLARRAFIARDAQQDSEYTALIQQAETKLNTIITAGGAAYPLSIARAQLWLAKIELAGVGEAHSYADNLARLDRAAEHLQRALVPNILRGTLLLDAQTTGNEIRLWRAELALRRGERYAQEDVENLQRLAYELFQSEPINSLLLTRVIRDLVEAYSARRQNHPQLIALVRTLLNLSGGETSGPIFDLRTRLGSRQFRPDFRTWLLLQLADATSWAGPDHLDEADQVLDLVSTQHAAVVDPQSGDPELRTRFQLLRAEFQMRRTRSAAPITDPNLVALVHASNQIDLITRLIFDQFEGLAYERNFTEIITLANALRSEERLRQIEAAYGDRQTSFQKYQFRLWLVLADNLAYSGEANYQTAVETYNAILSALPDLQSRDQELADLYRTSAEVGLADVLRYNWHDDAASRAARISRSLNYYQGVIARYPDVASPSTELTNLLIRAQLGLAEIRRTDRANRDYAIAAQAYTAAATLADAHLVHDSDEYHEVMAQVSLGRAQLAREGSGWLQRDLTNTWILVREARRHLDQVHHPKQELNDEIRRLENDRTILSGIRPEASTDVRTYTGGTGRSETQIVVGTEVPIMWRDWTSLHLRLSEQIDLAPNGDFYTTYGGVRFFPHSSLSLGSDVRLGTGGEASVRRYFHHPDLRLNAFWWNPYATLGGSVDLFLGNSDLNSYNVQLAANWAWTRLPIIRNILFPSVEFNSVPFFAQRDADPRRISSFFIGFRFDIPATDWLSLRGAAGLLPSYSPDHNRYTRDEWQMGWQVGAGLGIHLLRYLDLNADYTHQSTATNPFDMFRLNALIRF